MNVGEDEDDGGRFRLEEGNSLLDDAEFLHLEPRFFQQKHGVHTSERLVLDDADCPIADTSHVG